MMRKVIALAGLGVAALAFWLLGAPALAFLAVLAACWLLDLDSGHAAPPFELCDTCATPDHLFPHSRGGQDTADNLVTACWACNLSKGNRTPDEWAAGARVLSIARPRAVIPQATRQFIYMRDGWRCRYCAAPVHDRLSERSPVRGSRRV